MYLAEALNLHTQMKTQRSQFSWLAIATLSFPIAALAVTDGTGLNGVFLEFDTSLTSLSLSGGPFPIPLASDPGNALGDSIQGYGFVNSQVSISLSSQRTPTPGPATLGMAYASLGVGTFNGGLNSITPVLPVIDPNQLHGQSFRVNSFFDVFFDITVTDVDSRPGRNYAGQVDGASFMLPNNGPAHMQSLYDAIFDKNAPNFGLVPPPEVKPYIGHFLIEIPLGGDINGNGEFDKIKFELATHSVGDVDRQFVFDPITGTWIDTFDSAAFLAGSVVDVSTDPPFTIGSLDPLTGLPIPSSFGGPTTGTSHLNNPLVPESGTYFSGVMLGLGALGVYLCRRHR